MKLIGKSNSDRKKPLKSWLNSRPTWKSLTDNVKLRRPDQTMPTITVKCSSSNYWTLKNWLKGNIWIYAKSDTLV